MTSRTVVITGASTGIGRKAAEWLHERGWTVFAGVRKDADMQAIRDYDSERMVPLRLDVTDPAHIAAAAQAVGPELDALVNNAGVGFGGPMEFIDLDGLRRQYEINVFGQVAVTQAFLPALRVRTGRIAMVGSIAGRVVTPLMGPYCSSKFALKAITHAFRQELAPDGLHVALVEPGAVNTAIWGKAKATSTSVRDGLPAEAEAIYGARLDQAQARFARQDGGGVEASVVAEAIEHALTAKRPRTRYLIGSDARMGAWVSWLAPDRTVDRLVGQR